MTNTEKIAELKVRESMLREWLYDNVDTPFIIWERKSNEYRNVVFRIVSLTGEKTRFAG